MDTNANCDGIRLKFFPKLLVYIPPRSSVVTTPEDWFRRRREDPEESVTRMSFVGVT